MKGRKRFLLAGIVLGAAMGWAMGYLRLPHLEKNSSFWVGFLASLALVSFLLSMVYLWNKNSLLTRLLAGDTDEDQSDENKSDENKPSENQSSKHQSHPDDRSGQFNSTKSRRTAGLRAYSMIWILVSLFIVFGGLASTLMIYQQNELLKLQTKDQNKSLKEQSELIESVRKSNVVFLTSSIADNIAHELESDGKLSEATILRIAALSNSCEPARFFEHDSLSVKALSLERGQLLLTLALMDIDSLSFARIKEEASFSGADLRGANLRGVDLSGVDLKGTDLRDANLSGANLSGADLREVNLWGANLDSADLGTADMRRVDLSWADLNAANLQNVVMDGAILKNTKMVNANLSEAIFQWGKSDGAILNGANMTRIDMEGTGLKRTNMTNANLTEANMRRTDLRDATLKGAELTNASVAEEDWIDQLNGWQVIGANEIIATYKVVDDTSGRIKFSEHCLVKKQ